MGSQNNISRRKGNHFHKATKNVWMKSQGVKLHAWLLVKNHNDPTNLSWEERASKSQKTISRWCKSSSLKNQSTAGKLKTLILIYQVILLHKPQWTEWMRYQTLLRPHIPSIHFGAFCKWVSGWTVCTLLAMEKKKGGIENKTKKTQDEMSYSCFLNLAFSRCAGNERNSQRTVNHHRCSSWWLGILEAVILTHTGV